MGLFDRSADTILALKVGELSAAVTALTARITELEARPTVASAPQTDQLSPRMRTALVGLSHGNQMLYRHLLDEAQGMLALGGGNEDEVIAVLTHGSPRQAH